MALTNTQRMVLTGIAIGVVVGLVVGGLGAYLGLPAGVRGGLTGALTVVALQFMRKKMNESQRSGAEDRI